MTAMTTIPATEAAETNGVAPGLLLDPMSWLWFQMWSFWAWIYSQDSWESQPRLDHLEYTQILRYHILIILSKLKYEHQPLARVSLSHLEISLQHKSFGVIAPKQLPMAS